MPIQKQFSIPQLQAVFWRMEAEEFKARTAKDLPPDLIPRLEQRKSPIHRQGFWAVRACFQALEMDPNQIAYASDGAPLYPKAEVSISHAKSMALVARGKIPLGVDIEQYTEKIHRIQSRFLHQQESFAASCTEKLVQIWTAKEALYKTLRIPGISFREQLCVAPFQEGDLYGEATFMNGTGRREFDLYYFYFNDYCASVAHERITS